MRTSTVSLFDPAHKAVQLNTAQFHFHSPSEHSIDGRLMDLELHIVHFLDPKVKNCKFIAGVLGFLFKVENDEFFDSQPNEDIEYHDRFLQKLI